MDCNTVLKVWLRTSASLDRLQSYLPQSNQAVFVYGGYWMADYVYPESSHPHASNMDAVAIKS